MNEKSKDLRKVQRVLRKQVIEEGSLKSFGLSPRAEARLATRTARVLAASPHLMIRDEP